MANPLADAIRRIVGFDPTRSQLLNITKRGSILGQSSIGYMEPDKATASSVTGPKDATLGDKAPNDGMVVTPTSGINTGGNIVDATDPTKSIYGPNDGVYSAADVINPNTTTLAQSNKFLTGIGMLTSGAQGGGTLNELNGITECVSSKSVAIRFDGTFVPPTGWENAETPPGDGPAEFWSLGTRWFAPPSFRANNPLSAAQTAKANGGHGAYSVLVDSFSESFPHPGGTVRHVYFWEQPGDETHATVSYYAQDETCTPIEGDFVCPTENPASPTHWPEDGVMQVTRSPTGNISSSTFEPLADRVAALAAGDRSTIDFCFDDGSGGAVRQGRMEATNEGGFMIYETIDGNGTGIYKIFGPDNRISGYADVAEAQAYRIMPNENEGA